MHSFVFAIRVSVASLVVCGFGGVVCFFFFFLLLLFQLVCLDCERKIQAFVCGNWVSFAVRGLKVSRRRGRGGLWGRGGDVRFRN